MATCSFERNSSYILYLCVPEAWSDEEIKEYGTILNQNVPSSNWHILKSGEHPIFRREREPCDEKFNHVHVILAS